MKFVALISGGKDSFFNIMHCMHNTHELVALANLHPANLDKQEIDLFMFQTVGHTIIDKYEQCVGVPLYKRAITGGSTNVQLEYTPTENDEIEDLYELLKHVQREHPDLEGVSCGAILSHYQRTRVENVCGRLGLTSLAYLWQLDQAELMSSMCALNLDARLVKVAAVGLTEKHLGKLILEMYPILTKLNQMYDVHVCGEGGEFETLVFDAPFFRKKLVVKSMDIANLPSDVSYVLKLEVEVVDKDVETETVLLVPQLLEEQFREVVENVQNGFNGDQTKFQEIAIPNTIQTAASSFPISPRISVLPTRIYISNIMSGAPTLEEQTSDIMRQIGNLLRNHNLEFTDLQHMTVYVADMANFARVNAIYGRPFERVYLPPSRVCVETSLPHPYMLHVLCVALRPKFQKMGIHIRSRLYWAPQNIGPYSQAIVEARESFKTATLSGQIPLEPSEMDIDSLMSQLENSVLLLQHLYRAKLLVGVRHIAYCVCFVTLTAPLLVASVWQNYVDDVENGQDFFNRLLIVQTSGLPKQAQVEWGALSYDKVVSMYEDEENTSTLNPEISGLISSFESSVVPVGDGHVAQLVGDELGAAIAFLRSPSLDGTHVIFYGTLDVIHKLSNMGLSAEWAPVLGVWNSRGEPRTYGMVWIS